MKTFAPHLQSAMTELELEVEEGKMGNISRTCCKTQKFSAFVVFIYSTQQSIVLKISLFCNLFHKTTIRFKVENLTMGIDSEHLP